MGPIDAEHRRILRHRERLKANQHGETEERLAHLHVLPAAVDNKVPCPDLRSRRGLGSLNSAYHSEALARPITPAGSTDCDGGHFSADNRGKVVPCKVPESTEF